MYKIFPSLWIQKCKDLDYCKTEEEIDAFASNVYLNVVVKSPEYQPDEYSDKYIKPKLQHYYFRANTGEKEKLFSYISISEESIESDHNLFSFGFLSTQETIFTVPDSVRSVYYLSGFDKDTMFLLAFYRNQYRYEHIRQIYGPMDCLGDIGGLVDALIGIGACFMYFC